MHFCKIASSAWPTPTPPPGGRQHSGTARSSHVPPCRRYFGQGCVPLLLRTCSVHTPRRAYPIRPAPDGQRDTGNPRAASHAVEGEAPQTPVACRPPFPPKGGGKSRCVVARGGNARLGGKGGTPLNPLTCRARQPTPAGTGVPPGPPHLCCRPLSGHTDRATHAWPSAANGPPARLRRSRHNQPRPASP